MNSLKNFKKMSAAMYGVIIICFFMPFVNLTCSGEKMMTFTGFQMVTGTTIQQPSMFGEQAPAEEVPAEPLAMVAFLIAIAGLALSFTIKRPGPLVAAILSGVGALAMLVLKAKLDNEALKHGQGLVQIEYSFGFWSSLLLFVASGFLNGFLLSHKDVPSTLQDRQPIQVPDEAL